jgi:hypothetical protein
MKIFIFFKFIFILLLLLLNLFYFILFILDKKLDDMTLRKYNKVRESILMMQQLNTKRFEKEDVITPGPDYYSPNYNMIENNGYSVIIYLISENIYIKILSYHYRI